MCTLRSTRQTLTSLVSASAQRRRDRGMACCGSRPTRAAAASTRPGPQQRASRRPAGPGAKQRPPPTQQRQGAAGPKPLDFSDGGSSTDDSGSEAESFYSADDDFPSSGAAEPGQDAESRGGSASDAHGDDDDVARVQALLSAMSPATLAAQGWERAASWSSDAGTACAYRKPATDDTGVFVFFFEGT